MYLPNDQWLMIDAAGHYRSSARVERDIVCVVETDEGQQALTPAEFAEKYGWKNDPEQAKAATE